MHKYRETKYFIVYDIETMEKRINNDDLELAGVDSPTKILSHLFPLSIASYVVVC
jgi:hypothetical protein